MQNDDIVLNNVIVEGDSGAQNIIVKPGRPVFILGRNGTGKSALINRLSGQLGDKVIYMPGSRPSYFDSESLSLTPASRNNLVVNLRGWDVSPDTRWRSISGTQRNEKAVHDLQAVETQFKIDAANDIKLNGHMAVAIQRLQSDDSPLDRVNALLAQANLPVQLLISGGELRAQQNGAVYSYARMSDGERSALVFAAEIVAAQSGSVFLIDEPELHLHPSIVVPLLTAFISERPDCGFIVCTHELALPVSCPGNILLVRGGRWSGSNIISWELDLLDSPDEIPESVKIDLIGSRRKILFIEGADGSLDQPLYSLLFPSVSVRSKESCKEVMRAVEGLRSVEGLHRSKAFGIVDHDGMSDEEKSELEKKGIYPLPIFSVENLYYSHEVISALATRQCALLGVPAKELIENAKQQALNALSREVVKHLASRIAERKLRDRLMQEMPRRDQISESAPARIEISLDSPYPQELAILDDLIEKRDLDSIIGRYPVRESGVLTNISKALHFSGRVNYEKAVLQAVRTDASVRNVLKSKLKSLALQLD